MICRSLQSLIRVRPKAGLATKAEQKDAHLKHELHNELEGPAKKGRSPTKMYWVDTESIFGGIVRYPPNGKNEIQVQERKKRLLQGAKAKLFFDETSALLFGPRVSKCPESLRSPYETEEADEQKEMVESISAGPGEDLGTLDQVATETEGRPVKPLSRPPKQVKISHETRISAYPTENSIKKPGKRSTKGMGRAKSDLDAEVKALPRLVTSVEEPSIAEGNVQKITQSGSVRAAENIEVLSKRKKSKSQLRVVVLKNEADLKSLVQSPMMNKSRPNFRHDADGLTLPDSMVLKVSTEALTSLSLTLETFPSVTNILAVTMSPENRKRLDNWKNKKIEEIGLEEFEKYQQGTSFSG